MSLSLLLTAGILAAQTPPPLAPMRVLDRWGRQVDARGVTLLDWEGQIANPRVKLTVVLPEGTPFPSEVYVGGTNARLHFDRSDSEDRSGIGKRIRVPEATRTVDFYVAIFPDRDGKDEAHELVIQLFGADRRERSRLRMPVRVADGDRPGQKGGYPIHLDYSEDRTGFLRNRDVQRVLRQAADDWAYFLADQEVDEVRAGAETTPIWGTDGFKQTRPVRNRRAYRGFLLYVTGIHHDEMRAGGSPSLLGRPQTSRGRELPLRRSGTVELDIAGNWNRLGWFLTRGDEDWWSSGNLRGEPSDLYSIALHEMGHAVAFQGTYARFGRAKADGLVDPALQAYLGGVVPKIDASEHFPGLVDPVSGYGAFGMEYLGPMKERRWLITKAHLLCLQAVGYRLRPLALLSSLNVALTVAYTARIGDRLNARVPVASGVPGYRFTVKGGALPPGVTLDEFDGTLAGRPAETGRYQATVEVEDNDPTSKPVSTTVRLEVRS